MALLSEVRIPHDMLRPRVVDVLPFRLWDVIGALATVLCGTGLCGWGIVLFSKNLGGWQ